MRVEVMMRLFPDTDESGLSPSQRLLFELVYISPRDFY